MYIRGALVAGNKTYYVHGSQLYREYFASPSEPIF